MAKVLQMLEKMGFVERVRDPALEVEAMDALPAEPAETAAAEPPEAAPEHRTIPAVELDRAEAEALGSSPEEFPVEKIYASAGIEAPEHGFTVHKLIEMMNADEVAGLDPATKASVIAGLLRHLPGGAVDIDDIVEDAARRDSALDAFEQFLSERIERTTAEVAAENERLQLEIDELVRRNGEQMEANRRRLDEERSRFDRWCQQKQAEEQRLHDAVQPFVEHNPVTRADEEA